MHNKAIYLASKLAGPPLRRLFCVLITQNNQLRSGR